MSELSGGDESVGNDYVNTRTENSQVVNLPSREEGETAIHYLGRLRNTGRYLFHGSSNTNIPELEPRKASDSTGREWACDTAVYADRAIGMAVRMALIPPKEQWKNGDRVKFRDTPGNPQILRLIIPDEMKLVDGVVYVLPRNGFEPDPQGGRQMKSKEPVKTLGKVPIILTDYTEGMGGLVMKASEYKEE